ncbi:response regulator transcription factor [Blastococcus sp. CT_GayMR16]|uniref:response regulator n=1 Tax=Blastococcus sp. CT_GayMR16 TaxID=2559607 RepID=UPI0010738482|nr:response regulator transcription factor [Blastococcus sp. CT_GayMR16]TFV87337.1 response regulator transcription factor [Blastococcus sp. CT_GayMR16]
MTRSCACGQPVTRASGDIRVLVVDDHPLVRTTLAELLSDEDGLTVVGECEDGSQVVEASARLHPDVVLMDLAMPGMNGLAATEALRAVRREPRIVMLTGEGAGARTAVQAAGADALVPKGTRANALLDCLRTVVSGCDCCPYCF